MEGRPGGRYYGGAEFADRIETLAIERAKALFGCGFANVQPHSGSQANQAVFLALLKPGDTLLSMALDARRPSEPRGGAESHWQVVQTRFATAPMPRASSTWMRSNVSRTSTGPKLIICGGSAYPRVIDFAGFRAIADSAGSVLLADMAHFAGSWPAAYTPSPLPHAHVTTATTYKNLRGGARRDHTHRRSRARAQARQRGPSRAFRAA